MADLNADGLIHLRVQCVLLLWSVELDVHKPVFDAEHNVVLLFETLR